MREARWTMLIGVTGKTFLSCVIALPFLAACRGEAVEWQAVSPLAAELALAATWALDDSARLVPAAPDSARAPSAPNQCVASVRLARDARAGDWYAAWWGTRPDSTADLLAAHSADGLAWSDPVRVDTMDIAPAGCRNRAPPGVYADAGNFYVVYSMAAREGPGIFASHSMDRGKLFHSPVAVVYGERIGLADVAARGALVAVAYEDPNTQPRRISLALSRTMGHLFQSRTLVSPPSATDARDPRVAIGEASVAVIWTVGPADAERRMARIGRFQERGDD